MNWTDSSTTSREKGVTVLVRMAVVPGSYLYCPSLKRQTCRVTGTGLWSHVRDLLVRAEQLRPFYFNHTNKYKSTEQNISWQKHIIKDDYYSPFALLRGRVVGSQVLHSGLSDNAQVHVAAWAQVTQNPCSDGVSYQLLCLFQLKGREEDQKVRVKELWLVLNLE